LPLVLDALLDLLRDLRSCLPVLFTYFLERLRGLGRCLLTLLLRLSCRLGERWRIGGEMFLALMLGAVNDGLSFLLSW